MWSECRDASCKQRFPSADERDDHELAARHWDDEPPRGKGEDRATREEE